MADCKYCGKPAGFFHHAHPDCEKLHSGAFAEVGQALQGVLVRNEDQSNVAEKVQQIASTCFVGPDEMNRIVAAQISGIIEFLSNSRLLTSDDESRAVGLCSALGLGLADCPSVGDRFKKANVLTKLELGQFPKATISGYNPIQFHKDENLIWVFNDCALLEHHKSVSYVGASGGFSVRVAKGLYCHASSSRGHRVEQDHLVRTATGNLAITSKNIYFASNVKSMRIPMRNVVAVNLFADAIQISKSNTGAPLTYKLDDPPFAANLLSHLTG